MDVSALILTLNEEINLPRCLKSLSWCDDIVVLDSYSTDQTESIARKYGARFIQRKFDGYATQRNFGINEIDYKHPWVLMVDADESLTAELTEEIRTVLSNNSKDICLYRMRRKDFFMGRWIRYSSGYPTWFGRLVKIGQVRVERAINEEYHTDGKVGYLQSHLLHHTFNKGFHTWLENHNRYSTMEAELMSSKDSTQIRMREFYHPDPVARRKAVKKIVYSLPFRPFIMFFGMYFLKRGFLDGRAGLTFCILRSFYEYMIDCKIKEYRIRQKGLSL